MSNETIPVLVVRQPWASLIAEGHKTIEVRSTNTLKRGTIAIYASRTKPNSIELIEAGIGNDLPSGKIIAVADITESYKCNDTYDFRTFAHRHLCSDIYFMHKKTYFWQMNNIKKIEPIPFKATSIIWSKIEKDKIKVV